MVEDKQNIENRARRWFRRAKWVLVLFAILTTLAVVAETFLRLSNRVGLNDPEERARYFETLRVDRTLIRNRGGLKGRFGGVDVRINQQGFRGPRTHTAKLPGTYRIMLLGDEKTFGWRVPEEKTFAARLQQLLDTTFVGRFEVLNGGVPGNSFAMVGMYVQQIALTFQPDVIVVLLDGSDLIGDNSSTGDGLPLNQGLAQRCFLFRLFHLPSRKQALTSISPAAAVTAKRVFNQIERTAFRLRIDLFMVFWAPEEDPWRALARDALPPMSTWVWARPVDTSVALARLPRTLWRTGLLGDYPSEQAHELLAQQLMSELSAHAVGFFFVRRDGLPTPRNRAMAGRER